MNAHLLPASVSVGGTEAGYADVLRGIEAARKSATGPVVR